jgi:hypothetical protein
MKTNQFLFKVLSITVIAVLCLIGFGSQPAKAAKLEATGTFCDQYYSTSNGNYQMMTNYWNKAGSAPNTECINITSSGFSITTQDQVCATNGAPCAYPAVYIGCHYSTCSPNTNLPMMLSQISAANTSTTETYSSGTFDASYDIWINADTNVSGVQDTEIMIWLNHNGSIQPIGSQVASGVSLAGKTWNVWSGSNGQNNVVSYVATSALSSFSADVKLFIMDAITRYPAWGTTSWYLTSIQDGFEPWSGGTGLAITNFSASVTTGGGGSTPTRTPTPTNTLTPTRTNTPGGPTNTPTKTPTPGSGGGSTCSPVANTYTAAFDKAGPVSSVCIKFNNLPNNINSYGMTSVTIGGANYTNMWVSKTDATFISKKAADGYWYAVITAPDSNGHFIGQ